MNTSNICHWHHWPRWLTIAVIVIFEASCGDTTINNLPPDDARTNANGTASTADWTQAQQSIPCNSISTADCSGSLGLTINNSGQFAVANNGSIIVQGNITQSELAELNQKIQAAKYRDFERAPIRCVPARNQDQDQDQGQLDIILPRSQKMRIYDHKPKQRQVCFRGPQVQTQAINIYLKVLIQQYITIAVAQPTPIAPAPPRPSPTPSVQPIPSPIPSPIATPSATPTPQPSPSPSASPSTLLSGDWGGQHAAIAVNDDNIVFQFDCAHGEVLDAVRLDALGHFETRGTIQLEGGPEPATDRPSIEAQYSGRVSGDNLLLNVKYIQNQSPQFQTFNLTKDQEATITPCL